MSPQLWKSLIYLLFSAGLSPSVVAACSQGALRLVQARAHLADRPELDKWAINGPAQSSSGLKRSDGSDAEPTKDADSGRHPDGGLPSSSNCRDNGSTLPSNAVVPGGNRYGQTLV